MPGHAVAGGAAPYQFIAQERVYVVYGVELYSGRLLPTHAEGSHAPFHFAQHPARFAAQTLGTEIAATDDMVAVVPHSFGYLATACDHEGRRRIRRADREGEGVKAW